MSLRPPAAAAISRGVPDTLEPSPTGPGLLLPLPVPAAPTLSRPHHLSLGPCSIIAPKSRHPAPLVHPGGPSAVPPLPPSARASRSKTWTLRPPPPHPLTRPWRSRPRAAPRPSQVGTRGAARNLDWPAGQSLRRAPGGEAGSQSQRPGSIAPRHCGCGCARAGGREGGARRAAPRDPAVRRWASGACRLGPAPRPAPRHVTRT